MVTIDDEEIKGLRLLLKTYDDITLASVKRQQRVAALGLDKKQDDFLCGSENRKVKGLNFIKGRLERDIQKAITAWPIWNLWLKSVPGIGPVIAGKLIFLFYYRMIPTCKKCNGDLVKKDKTLWCDACAKSVSGEGLVMYRIGNKDFPNISAWRKYMGEHIIDGKKPKRQAGQTIDWSPAGRTLSFLIGESFNKAGGFYKEFYDKRKEFYQASEQHQKESKGHIHNMCKSQASKLFLSHFWDVAKRIDGVVDPAKPWIIAIGGHSKYIPPYYWEDEALKNIGIDKF